MLHSIVGLMSSGKTLIMTLFLYLDYLKGRDIVTNYHVNFPHYRVNRDWIIEQATKGIDLKNASFGFDEFWIWIDSRKAMENTVITYFLNQTSKNDVKLYATAQDNNQFDVRFRKNLHKLTNCYRKLVIDGKTKSIPPQWEDDRILPPFLDPFTVIKIINFKKQNVGLFTELRYRNTLNIPAQNIFKLYDTRAKILAEV